MKHAILIIAHDNLAYLNRLVDYFDEDFSIYIHLDRKSKFPKKQIENIEKKRNVAFVSRKYKTNWGGFNILKAELYLIKRALKNNDADYFHLISGQDIPTKSIDDFKFFFEGNRGREFIEYGKFPRLEWEDGSFVRFQYYRPYDLFNCKSYRGQNICNKIIGFQQKYHFVRRLPLQFKILYGGSAWFSLSRDCVRYVINYTKEHPSYYNRLKYTFAPDETYINTILLHSPFKSKIKNNNLRYIDWTGRNNSFPSILNETDYQSIKKRKVFFARKIILPTSQKLIDKLNII